MSSLEGSITLQVLAGLFSFLNLTLPLFFLLMPSHKLVGISLLILPALVLCQRKAATVLHRSLSIGIPTEARQGYS